jgi:hypothetical protein
MAIRSIPLLVITAWLGCVSAAAAAPAPDDPPVDGSASAVL